MKLIITLSQILSFKPCVPRTEAAIRQFGRRPGPDEAIPLVAMADAGLTLNDLCWILARTHREILVAWAADCAERKIEYAEARLSDFEARRPDDTRPRNAIAAAKRCVDGIREKVDTAELRHRRNAAYAAYAAAANAYADAADAAYADAAYAAAAAAAYAADANTTRKEHRDWCRARLREYLSGERPLAAAKETP